MITPRVIFATLLACAISTNARPQGFDPSQLLQGLTGGAGGGDAAQGLGGLPNPLSFLQGGGDDAGGGGFPLPPNPLELLGGGGADGARDARQSGGGFNPLEIIGQLLQPLIQKFTRLFGALTGGGGGGGDAEGGGGGISGILSIFQPLLNLLQPLLDKLGRIFGPILSTVLGALGGGGGGGGSSGSSDGDPGFKISIATTGSPNEISGGTFKRSIVATAA